jgi:hypothetical protein
MPMRCSTVNDAGVLSVGKYRVGRNASLVVIRVSQGRVIGISRCT